MNRLIKIRKEIILIFFVIFIFDLVLASDFSLDMNASSASYSESNNRYVTDDDGNILMYVNIWGHVKNPGNHLVFDGIDLITLLSVVGGPLSGAKMSKILIYRENKDTNGKIKYEINLNKFYASGDRSELVKIMPNDTIVIKEGLFSKIFRSSNALTTVLQILSIYIQIESNP